MCNSNFESGYQDLQLISNHPHAQEQHNSLWHVDMSFETKKQDSKIKKI